MGYTNWLISVPVNISNYKGREMTNAKPKIIYCHTDEAPALATYSFRPIIQTLQPALDVAGSIPISRPLCVQPL